VGDTDTDVPRAIEIPVANNIGDDLFRRQEKTGDLLFGQRGFDEPVPQETADLLQVFFGRREVGNRLFNHNSGHRNQIQGD